MAKKQRYESGFVIGIVEIVVAILIILRSAVFHYDLFLPAVFLLTAAGVVNIGLERWKMRRRYPNAKLHLFSYELPAKAAPLPR